MTQKVKLSWDMIRTATDCLAYALGPFEPKGIIGIARGGLIPGTMLSHVLQIPLLVVAASSYQDKKTRRTLKPRIITKIEVSDDTAKRISKFGHQNLIILDDILDTGNTVMTAKHKWPDATYAVLVNKRPGMFSFVNHFAHIAPEVWVDFPWEG